MTNASFKSSTPGRGFDFISQQLVPVEVAEFLFAFYQRNMDHYVHGILADADSLLTIRMRSSLLLVAICTVAAFCSGSAYYSTLVQALQQTAQQKVFASNHEFDDVRALCIGALWLPEISTALNGLGKLNLLVKSAGQKSVS